MARSTRLTPAGEVGVDHAPQLGIVVALEFVTDCLANRAVEAVGADDPACFQGSLAAVERTEQRARAPLPLLETGKLDAALHLTAKLIKLLRQDALGLVLGNCRA